MAAIVLVACLRGLEPGRSRGHALALPPPRQPWRDLLAQAAADGSGH